LGNKTAGFPAVFRFSGRKRCFFRIKKETPMYVVLTAFKKVAKKAHFLAFYA